MDDATLWVLVGAGVLAALAVSFFVLRWIYWGAIVLFHWAAEQAFLGVIAYAAAWVFLFPLMLVASLVVGILAGRFFSVLDAESRQERAAQRWREKNLGEPRRDARLGKSSPPEDPSERYKWANRLPPYDR